MVDSLPTNPAFIAPAGADLAAETCTAPRHTLLKPGRPLSNDALGEGLCEGRA